MHQTKQLKSQNDLQSGTKGVGTKPMNCAASE
jgi:hypothetical protein